MQIDFTVEELQRIVTCLGNYPYKDVADLIDKIKMSVNSKN